jgi:glycosyltransferase involved in cell wall biosynthesis
VGVTKQERHDPPAAAGGVATTLRPYVPEVRAEAVREFEERHANIQLAPVTVVVAAYDEEGAIGHVLDGIAPEACGLAVETIVVDDGSGDRTSEVAEAHGAYVVTLRRNCGHGIALRVGYDLASRLGARFIVTLDADGEWDPADIPSVLQPLIDDEADFVVGSRVLGTDEGDDLVRRAGVRVFAALVRLLTGVHVTDTSSALRALRPEVTQTVRQEQVQYQTSELLIGAICRGYRVTERPVSHHSRLAGESKKGASLLYGFRYARVIVRTWRRDRRSRAAATSGIRP